LNYSVGVANKATTSRSSTVASAAVVVHSVRGPTTGVSNPSKTEVSTPARSAGSTPSR